MKKPPVAKRADPPPVEPAADPPMAVPEALPAVREKMTRPLVGLAAAATLTAIGLTADATFIQHFTVFVLACFIGWQVIWNVSAALHTPLMAVTNAISGIIIVGGILQTAGGIPENASAAQTWAVILGAVAILFASVNVAGGFLVTQRMLKMFRK